MDIIIGAGITGLSYASFCGHNDYLIIEAEEEAGGYCKTIFRNGFVWDYSGHFFHFNDNTIKNYLLENIDETLIREVIKKTFILYKNNYIDFPFQKNIHQLNKEEFIDCLYDLFFRNQEKYNTFQEMLYSNFGKSISEKFLIPYNEKLYACDLNTLDSDAMGRFFPYASIDEIIANFKNAQNDSYNSKFSYPTGGAVEYIKSLLKRVDKNKIITQSQVTKIDIKNKIVYSISGTYKYDRLISTIPLPKLLDLCAISFDSNTFSWNKVLVFNLGFDKKGNDTTSHWIYFPESKYCFYRVGYYDNILNQDRMSLYVELGFNKNAIFNENEFFSKVLKDLKSASILSDQKLIDHHSVIMDPAYVHITKLSNDAVRKFKDVLSAHDIHSIGRYGSWTYCSIEDNIIQAKKLTTLI